MTEKEVTGAAAACIRQNTCQRFNGLGFNPCSWSRLLCSQSVFLQLLILVTCTAILTRFTYGGPVLCAWRTVSGRSTCNQLALSAEQRLGIVACQSQLYQGVCFGLLQPAHSLYLLCARYDRSCPVDRSACGKVLGLAATVHELSGVPSNIVLPNLLHS